MSYIHYSREFWGGDKSTQKNDVQLWGRSAASCARIYGSSFQAVVAAYFLRLVQGRCGQKDPRKCTACIANFAVHEHGAS